MTDVLSTVAAALGVDETAARQTLAEAESTRSAPWYVQAMLGFGAWIAALALFGAGVALIFLTLADSFNDIGTPGLVLGAAAFAAGLAILRGSPVAPFKNQFGVAFAAAGISLAAAGLAEMTEGVAASALLAVLATALVAAVSRSQMLQFLTAALAFVLAIVALADSGLPLFLDWLALAFAAGVGLQLRPPTVDLRAVGLVLLLLPLPAGAIVPELGWLWGDVSTGGLVALAVYLALFGLIVGLLWRRWPGREARVGLAVLAIAAAVATWLLPLGGSGALVVLALAFLLGSRLLALLGALLQAWFLWQFYYDLGLTLLVKSLILVAVGAALLVLWGWLTGSDAKEAGR